MTQGTIRIRGARQHNLKNLDLDIRTGELTVVTGAQRLEYVNYWLNEIYGFHIIFHGKT